MAYQGNNYPGNRPALVLSGGGGDTAFVDVRDLHPVNETVATIGGAAGGAILGGLPSLFGAIDKEIKLPKAFKGGTNIAIIAGTAALGAIVGNLNARTHNQWSDRVTASALDNQKSGQSV